MSEEYEDEDIILSELPDEELVEQMHDDLYDGLAEEIAEATQILLDRGWSATRVLDEALVAGMTIVGIDFRDGILFVPEVLMSANAMKAGMALLKPILADTGAKPVGTMVVGTVKGDIHDIGKNLVGMMMEGAGFRGGRPGHQRGSDGLYRRPGEAQGEYSRHVGAADDHDAVHESGDRYDEGTRHS